MPLLTVRDLSVRFGAVHALRNVSMEVEEGTLVGLIGANGAGKTTMLDAITGFVPATGSASFAGTELLGLPAHRRARLGICRTWQSVELFDDLTVLENLQVASGGTGLRQLSRSFLGKRSYDAAAMERILEQLQVSDVLQKQPTELSEGDRKLVGLARTLMSRPRLILADEPAAGLDSTHSRWLGERLRDLVDTGLTMVLVDHDMGLVLGICDQIVVLDHGELLMSGSPQEVRSHPAVIAAYLGTPVQDGDGDLRPSSSQVGR